jgi:hypothetical protein
MPVCQDCGNTVEGEKTFCTSCGAKMIPSPDPMVTLPVNARAWSRAVPLITNAVVVRDVFLALFIPAALAGILFTVIVGDAAMLILFLGIAAGIFVLGLVIMAVIQLGSKGGLMTDFYISDEGVASRAGKGTKALNRAAALGSLAMGSRAGTGAGLLAISGEATTLFWENVRYVTIRPGQKMIVLRSPSLISPVALYCTDENFTSVVEMIRKYAPASAKITTR